MREPPFNVLVFPSSNEPGLEAVNALSKSNKVEVLGGSSYGIEYDPSRLLVRRHLRCPALGEPEFRTRFQELIAEHNIDAVFPTVDAVVAELSTWDWDDVVLVATDPGTARLVSSKRNTYRRVADAVPVPAELTAPEIDYPAFAKPDVGSGSVGGRRLDCPEDLAAVRRRSLLVQEYLPGEEYTVDCIGDLNGRLMFANVRLRGEIARGISVGTSSVDRDDIRAHVERVAEAIPIRGPWFAQFKAGANGEVKLLEVNARIAGSSTLTRLSGVNLPLAAVFMFMGHEVSLPRRLPGITVNRCLRNLGEVDDFDWVIWDLDDTLIRKDGKPDPEAVARLYDLDNRGVTQILLTKNPDPQRVLEESRLPPLFAEIRTAEDKVAEVAAALARHRIDPARCVMINDSVSERLAIETLHPDIRVVMPDALDVLARERVS